MHVRERLLGDMKIMRIPCKCHNFTGFDFKGAAKQSSVVTCRD